MTPIKQVSKLREDFIDQINSVFENNTEIFSIEFFPEENDVGIEPAYLTKDAVLTCVDEFGNDYDNVLTDMSIDVIAVILTLIQGKKYSIYERI